MKIIFQPYEICNLFKSNVIVKQTPAPSRWMAIELRINDDPNKSQVVQLDYSPTASEKCDVWSFGIIIWELLSIGKTPELFSFEELIHGKRLRKDEETMTQKM